MCFAALRIFFLCFHAVGVSLMFQGEVLPSDSYVDIDDIMYTLPSGELSDLPSNMPMVVTLLFKST